MIVDFHVHVFPDKLAEKALPLLANASGLTPSTKGTLASTVDAMKKYSIDKIVALNIASTPHQEPKVNDFALAIGSDEIIPFGSVHPLSDNWENELERLHKASIKGVKLHPEYQNIDADDKAMYPIYDRLSEYGMIALFHSGADVAFPNTRRAHPYKMAKVIKDFPRLKTVLAHFGGYGMWDEVTEYLLGKEVFFDTSNIGDLSNEKLLAMLNKHDKYRVLFASDTPWDIMGNAKERIMRLNIDDNDRERILGLNALEILELK